jgi:hypothetical protein
MNPHVVVIAGGFSVKSYDLSKLPVGPLYVGVNDAGYHFPCEHVLTMDRLWFEHRYSTISRVPVTKYFWIRKGINKIIPQLDPKVREFACDNEALPLLDAKGMVFNGSNSGTVALNLAYQLSLRNIFLLGYDMQKGPNEEPYWYPPYPWNPTGATKPGKYQVWAKEFEEIARQLGNADIKIYNVNHRSKIGAFPTMSFEQMLCQLKL